MDGDLLDDFEIGVENQVQVVGTVQHHGDGGGVRFIDFEVYFRIGNSAELRIDRNGLRTRGDGQAECEER